MEPHRYQVYMPSSAGGVFFLCYLGLFSDGLLAGVELDLDGFPPNNPVKKSVVESTALFQSQMMTLNGSFMFGNFFRPAAWSFMGLLISGRLSVGASPSSILAPGTLTLGAIPMMPFYTS